MTQQTIDKYAMQNSPVNNALIRNPLLNMLCDQDGKEPQEVIVQNGKNPVRDLCCLYYSDTVDLTKLNRSGRSMMTSYDRRVYNAICTMWMSGYRSMSFEKIYSLMNGYKTSNPNSKQIQAIKRSLLKLSGIRIELDMTNEVKAGILQEEKILEEAGIIKKKSNIVKSAKLDDSMLHYSIISIVTEGDRIYESVEILQEPCLLTYNRAKRTLLIIPIQYLAMNGLKATTKNIALQEYLLMRIICYKKGKMTENKILYESLYAHSGLDLPSNKTEFYRDRLAINTMLKGWVEQGLIVSFSDVKIGNAYKGIMFHVKQIENADNAYTNKPLITSTPK